LGLHQRSKIKSTPECTILKRKIQKFSPQRGPVEMFGGPASVSPCPAVALDGPGLHMPTP